MDSQRNLQTDIDEIVKNLDNLRSEAHNIELTLKLNTSGNEQIDRDINEIQESLKITCNYSNEIQETFNTLEQEIENLSKMVNERPEQIKKLDDTFSNLLKELEDALKQELELMKKVSELENIKFDAEKNELQNLKLQEDKLKNEYETHCDEKNNLLQKLAKEENEMSTLQNLYEKGRIKQNELECEKSDLARMLSSMQTELESHNKILQEKKKYFQETQEKLVREKDELRIKITETKNSLLAEKEARGMLEQALEQFDIKIKIADDLSHELQVEISEIETMKSEISEKVDKKKQEFDEINLMIDDVSIKISEVQLEIQNKQKALDVYIEDKTKELQNIQEEIKENNDTNNMLMKQTQLELDQKIVSNNTMEDEIENINSLIQAKKITENYQKRKLGSYQRGFQDTNAKIEKYEEALKRLRPTSESSPVSILKPISLDSNKNAEIEEEKPKK